jgi:integrase
MIQSKIGLTPRTYEALFGLLACTGLRVSEALALTLGDVDLEQGLIRIRGSKSQKSRLVPLHVSAIVALRTYSKFHNRYCNSRASQQFFLRDAGASIAYYHVRLRFRYLRRKLNWTAAGRTRLPRIHDLRHSWASHMLASGADLAYVSNQLGHANPSITLRIYSHWVPGMRRVMTSILDTKRANTPEIKSHPL